MAYYSSRRVRSIHFQFARLCGRRPVMAPNGRLVLESFDVDVRDENGAVDPSALEALAELLTEALPGDDLNGTAAGILAWLEAAVEADPADVLKSRELVVGVAALVDAWCEAR